jgi:hypothetical protein
MNNPLDYAIDLEISKHGVVGTIDNVSATFLIKKCNDNVENSYNLNTLIAKTPFKQGSIIVINNDSYLVLDIKEQFQDVYYKGTIRKCESFKTALDDKYVQRHDVLGFVDKDKSTLISSDYFLEENTYINVTIPLNQYKYEDAYILYKNRAYMIVGNDDTKEGIRIINAKFKSEGYDSRDVYVIECSTNTITLDKNETIKINPIVKKNDVALENPILTYTSKDETIATCNNGLIEGIRVGSTTITINYQDKVQYTVNVSIGEVQVTYTINGVDSFKQENSSTFTINPLRSCAFYIDDFDSSEIAYITSDNGNGTCVVYGINNISDNYFTLYAKDSSGNVLASKEINVLA